MSECGVCLGDFSYDDWPCEFWDVRWVKARKSHRCSACGTRIDVGTRYNRFSGKFDGDMFSIATCSDCYWIREAFTCEQDEHIPSEVLWDTMHENVFPEMTTACLGKVKDDHARETLRTKWMQWKGLEL